MSKIVHFEIPVDDADRASAFYRTALGWEISGYGDMPYWLVRAGAEDEPGADGALCGREDLHKTPVLVAGVEDLEGTIKKIEGIGGQVIQGKMPIPGVGWSAYIRDSEGNTIGLFQADSGAPAGQ